MSVVAIILGMALIAIAGVSTMRISLNAWLWMLVAQVGTGVVCIGGQMLARRRES
jgi:hypothetical protein